MRTRTLRFLASLVVTAVWLVAGTRPAAVAWHVASGHGHEAHGAPTPSVAERTEVPQFSATHEGHAHGLVETVPGVRNDTRISVNALPLPAGLLPLVPDDAMSSGVRRFLAARPGVPPPEAPSVLRL